MSCRSAGAPCPRWRRSRSGSLITWRRSSSAGARTAGPICAPSPWCPSALTDGSCSSGAPRIAAASGSPSPAGFEAGEEPEAAARRELLEETGADVPVMPLGYRHGFGIEPGLLRGAAPGAARCRGDRLRCTPPTGIHLPALGRAQRTRLVHAGRGAGDARFAGLRKAVRLAADRSVYGRRQQAAQPARPGGRGRLAPGRHAVLSAQAPSTVHSVHHHQPAREILA